LRRKKGGKIRPEREKGLRRGEVEGGQICLKNRFTQET